MVHLRVLGSIELQDSNARELRSVLAQPKRLALLVYLAVATPRGFHRRDVLLSLFWPELDAARGRDALNQAVRFLRRELGGTMGSILISRGSEEICVNAAALWCDAVAFRDAIDAGRHAEAQELYRGDLLRGFFSEEAPGFEEWAEQERSRLRASAARSARALAEARESDASFTTAVASARRAVELSDVDERIVRELLVLLDRLGDRAGAVHAYDEFASRLATEYAIEPSVETKTVIDRIRAREGDRAERDEAHDDRAPRDALTAPLAASSPVAGIHAGGWQLIRELGQGGMAHVYLARDAKHGRHVALKLMRPELARTLGVERFLREIQITAQLAHPHILPLIDSGVSNGIPYLVTPYIAGETLRQRLRREPRLSVTEAIRLAVEIAGALAYAHRAGIIHRDIKPENILLADGQAVVADFGVARALSISGPATPISDSDPAAVVGSLAYRSPEQSRSGEGVDARSDLYSLGCVLYEMLTGRVPDRRDALTMAPNRIAEHLEQVAWNGGEVRAGMPRRLARVITTCLAADPSARFQGAPDLLAELETLTTARPDAPTRMRTRWRVRVAALGTIVAFAALAAFMTSRDRRERWVFETALPAIRQRLDTGDIEGAHRLARSAAAVLPNDSAVIAAWSQISARRVLRTSPAGARVYRAPYGDTTTWEHLGTTPTDTVWIPGRGGQATMASIYRIEKRGFTTRHLAALSFPATPLVLDSLGTVDSGMVRVDAGLYSAQMPGLAETEPVALGAFLIDRHETTNREFKAFVGAGGYDRPELWDTEFLLQGRRLTRSDAMARFVDRTARRGPATWEGGDYAPGEAEMPVGGISWYEARAYARWTGKSLPTVFHWRAAAGQGLAQHIVPLGNLESRGPRRVGTTRAMSPFGAFDMAGNVREWCVNASGNERYILGGGWNDPTYQFTDAQAQDPFDRSVTNGIRLMKYLRNEPNLAVAMGPRQRTHRDF
jgi:DNA-binding SARP family transcriptional activator/tRNA A-37 threonylcarbamoyl transferase component Bud32